jgi:hypothetical protein
LKIKGFRTGRQPVFSVEQEKLILEVIFAMSDSGFGLNIQSLMDVVQNFVKELKLKTPFKNDRPGIDWIYW